MISKLSASLLLAVATFALSHALVQSAAAADVKIRLDWKAGAQHAPFYLGKQRGYFKDVGINLNIISGSGSSDTIKQVGSGAVEFGLADALVLAQAAEQQVPVQSIAAYYQRSPIVVISPAENPMTDPQQLKRGVKLGSKKGSATYQGLIALLGANDMRIEEISLVDIGFGVQPLLVGQVDAMMGFAMNEPIEAETAGMPVQVMPISDYGVNVYGLTIISNTSFMSKNRELVRKFVKASLKSINEAIADPKAAVQAVAEGVPESDASREAQVLQHTIPYWQPGSGQGDKPGTQSQERWQTTIDVAQDLGLIETAPPPAALFTNEYLE